MPVVASTFIRCFKHFGRSYTAFRAALLEFIAEMQTIQFYWAPKQSLLFGTFDFFLRRKVLFRDLQQHSKFGELKLRSPAEMLLASHEEMCNSPCYKFVFVHMFQSTQGSLSVIFVLKTDGRDSL